MARSTASTAGATTASPPGIRGNLNTGKGAVQFAWTSPPLLGLFRGYVQVFSGYGESLIDYNWKQTTIGAGIALSDGL